MAIYLKSVPEAIQWHDGMLLTPQHFDDLSMRLERMMETAAVTGGPFNWGVLHLDVAESELLDSHFSIRELEAMMPDGLLVSHDSSTDGVLRLDMAVLEAEFRTGPFMVYAVVPAHADNETRAWRYVPAAEAETANAMEEDEADTPPIPRLRPQLTLMASRTLPHSRYSSLPLARMQFRNGVFARLETYLPPMRQLDGESMVAGTAVALLRRVREVAVVLQQEWRSLSAQERQDQDTARRNAVQQLASMLPYSEAMLEAGQVHPFHVYTTLCMLAGHVAGIAADPIPPNFPRYNHLDIAGSFAQVTDYIGDVLAKNSSSDFTGVPFQHGDGHFFLMFEPSWKGRQLVLALRRNEKVSAEMVLWADHALIGSSILHDSMRERRVLGARRVRVEREPGLFAGPDTALFRLTNDNEHILGGEMLEISAGTASRNLAEPTEMTLYVMHP